MLVMRLQRVGRRNDPSYRVVVTDKRTGPKSNKHVALLGSYNPKFDHIQIDKEAAAQWLQKGVQPSDTVHNILVGQGLLDAPKVNALPKKAPIIDEAAEAAKAAAAEQAAAEAQAETESDTESASPADDTEQAADTKEENETEDKEEAEVAK